MGTRNLISVVIDGETKVAQYCQWDGYLEGQGQAIVDFLTGLTKSERKVFKDNVRKCEFISDDEVQKLWESVGADDSGLVSLDVSDEFKKKYPEFHRDTGAGILMMILAKPRKLSDASSFAKEGPYCEFAYVIDLDAEVLRIFTGGTNPLAEVKLVALPEAFQELLELEAEEY